jgi:CRISPR-associated protein Csb1
MSEITAEHFDQLLKDDGPAAIVLKRKLRSVEGNDAFIFPATFAQSESSDDDEGGGGTYQIDDLTNDDRRNVCLIDSVGSQANRMEPIFKLEAYSKLVPQIKIKLKGNDEVNLLDAGHRAADAVIRFSKHYGPELSKAFREYRDERDCSRLLAIAPTSLIFGVWDSRATGTKIQRVVRSVIRAYNVTKIKRSATYQAAYDYSGKDLIDSVHDKGAGKDNPLSQEGFKYSLATGTHGGVSVKGGIQQEAVINLVALRSISQELRVRRYLLGLALVALSYRDQQGFNLREGCLLCAASKADFEGDWKIVHFTGSEEPGVLKSFNHEIALKFAYATTSQDDGVKVNSPAIADPFDRETAEKWLAIDKKKRKLIAKTKHPSAAVAEEAAAPKKKAGAAKGAEQPEESA